jgi:cold shock CspA family protein
MVQKLLREKIMHGLVTRILRKVSGGFVLTEAGDEVFFGSSALDGIGIDELEEGQSVEFEFYEFEMGRATITRLRSEDSPRFRNSRCA